MTTTLIHPDTVEELITDTLPPPLGEGRGEGHQSRSSSPPCATDSDAAAAEQSVHAPSPKSEGGTVEEALRLDRVVASPQPHTGDGGTVTRATLSGEALDNPGRALHQPASLHPRPQTPDPKPDLLNRLLTLYTTHSNSFNDLCCELDMTMLELLDLFEHPEVNRALERLAQASEARAKLLARVTSDSAISALIDLMDTTDKPETRRKSAGALLRHGKPTAKPSKRATDSDAVAAEKSVPPSPRSEGGTVEEALRLDRAVASPEPHTGDGGTVTRATPPIAPDLRTAGLSPRSRTEPRKSQAA